MRSVRSDEKPRWWSGLRGALEITVVIEMFRLMAQWLRRNRVALELRRRR